jgi:TP901 family phage tail tape measure protein
VRDTTIRLKLDISDLKAKSAAAAAETRKLEDAISSSAKRTAANQLREARRAQQDADRALRDADRALRDGEQMLARRRQAIGEIGGTFGVVGLAAAGAGALAVHSFANFDEAMSAVKATGKDAASNIGELRDAAMDMGAKTKFNATESAAAIEEMVKAGVSAKDVLGGGLQGALDMAAAGNIEVGEAAGYASQAMNQFRLEGKDVPHIADLLAAAAGKANGEISDFGQALNQTGLVASDTGLSLEETTGGLAAFAQNGLLGSDAGTSFKTMLQRLNPQSKEAADLMKKIGLSAYDSNGEFVGLAKYAGRLKDAFKGMTSEQRNSAMQTLFGSDAIRAANVLYREGEGGINKWVKAVNDQGFATDTAKTKMGNFKGDLEGLGGAFETALIGTGEGADGPLRQATQSLKGLVDHYNELPPAAKSATGGALAFTSAVGLGGFALSKAVVGYGEMRDNLNTLSSSFENASKKQMLLRGGAVAAGAGILALSGKAEESNEALGVFADTAGGAAIGFGVAGPWGAAIGGGIGLLKGLSGAFGDSAGAAKKAAREAQKTESWDAAKAGAESLRDALYGTVGAYNAVSAAAVKQGLTGKDGTPVEWVKDLQGAGVSMDTITRAVLGQRDAQALVNAEFAKQDAHLAALKKQRDDLAAQEPGIGADGEYDPELFSKQARELEKLREKIEEESEAVDSRRKAYEKLFGTTREQSKLEATLATSLGVTKKQYDALPKIVRTKIETDGLPQTRRGVLDLLKLSNDLDGKQVVSIVKASGVALSKKQVKDLAKQYDLTPKQIRTLLEADNNASPKADKVKDDLKDLDGTTAKVNVSARDAATSVIRDVRGQLRGLDGTGATVWIRERRTGGDHGGGSQQASANGNLFEGARVRKFADGGFDEFGRPVQRTPQIRSSSQGTVMWGEPETGWEAYVSGKPSQKPRNRAILSEAASRLGGNVEWFADGGFTEAVSSRELTGLQIRVRDLVRALKETEVVGNGKRKRKRLVLRKGSLDRLEAAQDLNEAKAELAKARTARVRMKKAGYGSADAYNEMMQKAQTDKENRQSVAGSFADRLDGDVFKSPASLERALSTMLRDSADFVSLLSDLKKKNVSPWLLDQLVKAGPSRATNRTMRGLLADADRLKRINASSKSLVGVSNSYAALTTGKGFTPTFSGTASLSQAQLTQITEAMSKVSINANVGIGARDAGKVVQVGSKFTEAHE